MRRCPGCHREAAWQDNPWRPFCSERCQMADLGRWVSGEYRIPLVEDPESIGDHDLLRESEIDEQN
ncbi:MAG: DNA gyrase inhibitor YacG [Acidobacteriota bacterium]